MNRPILSIILLLFLSGCALKMYGAERNMSKVVDGLPPPPPSEAVAVSITSTLFVDPKEKSILIASATSGDPVAAHKLATDAVARAKNYDEALDWTRVAMENGHVGATEYMTIIYSKRGKVNDCNRAIFWAEKLKELDINIGKTEKDAQRNLQYELSIINLGKSCNEVINKN